MAIFSDLSEMNKELQEKVRAAYEVMRPYQKEVLANKIQSKARADFMDMGMGKSLTNLMAVVYQEAFPCLIMCPKSAMYVWEDEIRNWFGLEALVYTGKPKERKAILKRFAEGNFPFIITNYALASEVCISLGVLDGSKLKKPNDRGTNRQGDQAPPWYVRWKLGSIIADEIHSAGLLNHKTATYKFVKLLSKEVGVRYFLTGTPIRKGVVDLFGPLSLVAPDEFNSYWSFVHRHCVVLRDRFGTTIERNPKDVESFRTMLRRYADIRKKSDHLSELPGKQRIIIPLAMEPEQQRVYEELSEEMFSETDSGEFIISSSVLGVIVRLRQILICPQVLGLSCRGAAIEALMEKAEEWIANGKPFVVFTPFKSSIRWIEEALRQVMATLPIFTLTGGLTPEQFRDQWQGFQNGTGTGALLCVIKSGASFHATRAEESYFLGYEWDFNQNEQAEDRLNRMGQTSMVSCYYPIYKGTIDEVVVSALNQKKDSSDWVLSADHIYEELVKRRNGNG